ncbi:MAG: holo-ACP synthase [Acidobacteria bacterium]|nr:holo-ACP synthase [Acidobacteriota bacterium]
MVIGTGIDIIEISRIQQAIDRNGELFLRRIFSPLEQAYCQARHLSAVHYAGRFAAKEAAFKALGTGWAGKIRWVDVEVESGSGPPKLKLSGVAAERFESIGATKSHLSISHSRDYAVAMVIFEA